MEEIEHIIKIQTTKNQSRVYVNGKEQELIERFVYDKTLNGIPGITLNFRNKKLECQYKSEEIVEEHIVKLQINKKETKIFLDEKLILTEKKFTKDEPIPSVDFYFRQGKLIKSSELQPDDLCNFR